MEAGRLGKTLEGPQDHQPPDANSSPASQEMTPM
jgi:hypothetical protein